MSIAVLSYSYKGRDSAGKIVKGKIEAPSEAAAVSRMRALGLTPVSVTEASATGLNREISLGAFEKGVSLKDLAVMSRQMATMVAAGIPLLKSLTILSDQTENKVLARVLGTVRGQVETAVLRDIERAAMHGAAGVALESSASMRVARLAESRPLPPTIVLPAFGPLT